MTSLSIVMPAYNEEENIEKTVRSCLEFLDRTAREGEVLVVNDGSRDRTGEILIQLGEEDKRVSVAVNSPNQGYGCSLQRGISLARCDLIATIDSDGQFEVNDLEGLFEELSEERDAVTGYRRKKQDSFGRVIADRGLNLIMRVAFGMKFKDTNCALKLFRKEALKNVKIEANGYPTPTELLVKLTALNFSIGEAPVSHHPREGGVSALKPVRTAVSMFAFLCYLRLKLSLYRRRIIREL